MRRIRHDHSIYLFAIVGIGLLHERSLLHIQRYRNLLAGLFILSIGKGILPPGKLLL